MKYKFIFLFLFILKVGITKAQTDLSKNNIFFSGEKFEYDTLFIDARFMECGEFGGHKEKSKVYKMGSDFYIFYQKYSFECRDQSGTRSNTQTLVTDTIKKLSNFDKSAIRGYINKLLTAKMKESYGGNAGSSFWVYNLHATLQIYVWENNLLNEKDYLALINSLFKPTGIHR